MKSDAANQNYLTIQNPNLKFNHVNSNLNDSRLFLNQSATAIPWKPANRTILKNPETMPKRGIDVLRIDI